MYVIMQQAGGPEAFTQRKPKEITNRLQTAIDRCRTLNKAATLNHYWFERVKPIIDASGTKAKQISF